MSLTGIIIILLIALILIFLEVFVLPGINVAGILGIILLVVGIYLGYTELGKPAAHFVLTGTLLASALILIFGLRANTWRAVSLNTSIDGKIDNFVPDSIKIGDTGVTITRLGPIGSVQINGQTFEAKSANIINAKEKIVVTEINGKEIIVKPLK